MEKLFDILFQGEKLKKENSLNLIRLLLALVVVYAHSAALGGYVINLTLFGKGIGSWAVFLFFGISGYLITASAFSNDLTTYFQKRIARIFPAYLTIQFITAFIFAPVIFLIENGTIKNLFTSSATPISYFIGNSMLRVKDYHISGTLTYNDYPLVWNGSTWTLWNEFICYILIAIVVSLIIKKKKLHILTMFLGWIMLSYLSGHLKGAEVVFGNGIVNAKEFIPLATVFMAGALLYTLRKYLVFNILGAVISTIISALLITLVPDSGFQFASPFIIFIVFVIANKVPSPKWVMKNDLSYGIYLISFPIQQLIDFSLIRTNVDIPFFIFFLLSSVISISLAYCSWSFVEEPSLEKVRKPTVQQVEQIPKREYRRRAIKS